MSDEGIAEGHDGSTEKHRGKEALVEKNVLLLTLTTVTIMGIHHNHQRIACPESSLAFCPPVLRQ